MPSARRNSASVSSAMWRSRVRASTADWTSSTIACRHWATSAVSNRLGREVTAAVRQGDVEVGRRLAEARHRLDAFACICAVEDGAQAPKRGRPGVAAIAFEALQQRQRRRRAGRAHVVDAADYCRRATKVAVLGQENAHLDIGIGAELQASEQLQNQRVAEANRRIALLAAHLGDGLSVLRDGIEQMGRLKAQDSARFGWNLRSLELAQQRPRHRRIVEPLCEHIRLRLAEPRTPPRPGTSPRRPPSTRGPLPARRG